MCLFEWNLIVLLKPRSTAKVVIADVNSEYRTDIAQLIIACFCWQRSTPCQSELDRRQAYADVLDTDLQPPVVILKRQHWLRRCSRALLPSAQFPCLDTSRDMVVRRHVSEALRRHGLHVFQLLYF